jgi:hypothetical protein
MPWANSAMQPAGAKALARHSMEGIPQPTLRRVAEQRYRTCNRAAPRPGVRAGTDAPSIAINALLAAITTLTAYIAAPTSKSCAMRFVATTVLGLMVCISASASAQGIRVPDLRVPPRVETGPNVQAAPRPAEALPQGIHRTENGWAPDPGCHWVDADDPKDLRVRCN